MPPGGQVTRAEFDALKQRVTALESRTAALETRTASLEARANEADAALISLAARLDALEGEPEEPVPAPSLSSTPFVPLVYGADVLVA